VKPHARAVTVICDATIAFPIIVASALERLGGEGGDAQRV